VRRKYRIERAVGQARVWSRHRGSLRIGIVTSSAALCRGFLERNGSGLAAGDLQVAVVVLDENRYRRTRPVRHKLRIARRQARLAGCWLPMAALRMAAYEVVLRLGGKHRPKAAFEPGRGVRVVRVGTANSAAAVAALREAGCRLVCVMNARVLTAPTLEAIGVPIVNVHLSNPRLFRGSHPVVREVLAGHEHIVLTVHEVAEEVDAGPILRQRPQPIRWRGGLGATVAATLASAWREAGDLLEEVLRRYAEGELEPQPFEPGPLLVTPSLREIVRAELVCRRRSRERRRGRERRHGLGSA
jgi:Formyl transferase